ncbi:hypothetical protein [Pedobacter arcticus]|uniref:hypothetical protein n=1 Tax=Pedobacter arcticus TaxID=752140 RepID=UPI0002D391B6|nr:hypothetical protein [Pedobacter arcticus]
MFKKVGLFEATVIYESKFFKPGHGLTIPQIGVITYPGAFSNRLDIGLIQHEFGHILQWRKLGSLGFYFKIGFPSLWSAIKASLVKRYFHQNHPVEINSNLLSYEYFNKPNNWDFKRFPIA